MGCVIGRSRVVFLEGWWGGWEEEEGVWEEGGMGEGGGGGGRRGGGRAGGGRRGGRYEVGRERGTKTFGGRGRGRVRARGEDGLFDVGTGMVGSMTIVR